MQKLAQKHCQTIDPDKEDKYAMETNSSFGSKLDYFIVISIIKKKCVCFVEVLA